MNVVSLLAKLPKERLHQYTEVRDYLMREFKLTAEQYRDKFRAAIKRPEQTYTLFGSWVKNLFLCYSGITEVTTEDQVVELLVSGRIKETFGPACLRHVLSTEGTDLYGQEKLSDVTDTYENSGMYLPCNLVSMVSTGEARLNFRAHAQSSLLINLWNRLHYSRRVRQVIIQTAALSSRLNTRNTIVTRRWLCNETSGGSSLWW